MQKPLILCVHLLLFCLETFALTISERYRSGPEICAEKNLKSEYKMWLQVPISYKNPGLGTTPLYVWTNKPYDPLKNTVVFISGGPGDTAHKSSFEMRDWNIIFFDQRGISCSRPVKKAHYLDRNFYSSENTARDIDEIRKSFMLEKVSIYGVSYGTIPAHLYGSIFPNRTTAVVLEGVISEGGELLIQPKRRTKILQKFFDGLPADFQSRILELSSHPEVSKNWFSSVGMKMLYLDNSLEVFRNFLGRVLWNEQILPDLLKSFEETDAIDVEFEYGHVMMGMIGCKELGMNLAGLSFYSVFEKRTLVPDQNNSLQKIYCQPLGFKKNEKSLLYQASRTPSKVPTTYFQGSNDGATVASNAVLHYRSATHGFAQLIVVAPGGHLPLYGPVSSGYEAGEALELRLLVLDHALHGNVIPKKVLNLLSRGSSLKWTQTYKNP